MPAITFPLTTSPGEYPQEGAGRLINCYAEPAMEGARSGAIWKRVPGLTLFVDTGESGFRGMIESGGVTYAVFEGRFGTFTAGGVYTDAGVLAGTEGIILARNNLSPVPNVVGVVGSDAFILTPTGVLAYPDSDVGSPNSVCFLDGYFFFTYGSGLCRSSGINTTDINLLDFITAESNPDGLIRGIPFKGQLLLFGSDSCEFWSGANVNAFGFPFNRVVSTPYGLGGKFAIAGHEPGLGTHLLWVGKDNGVYMLTGGYEPMKVSPPDLDNLIAHVADKNTLEASVYVARGRSNWVLSSPDWTWEFCITTMKWATERQSYLIDRWRGTRAQFCFGRWLCGDIQSGVIFEIDHEARREGDNPIRMRLESAPMSGDMNRVRINRIDVDVTTGVGSVTGVEPIETDPVIEISVAPDLVNFCNPRLVPLGRQARVQQRVFATRFGLSGPQGFRVRLDVSDPVHIGIVGATAEVAMRAK